MKRHIAALFGALALLMGGCEGERDVAEPGPCSVTADCDPGLVCVSGACVQGSNTSADTGSPTDDATASEDTPGAGEKEDANASTSDGVDPDSASSDTASQPDQDSDSHANPDQSAETTLPDNSAPIVSILSPAEGAIFAANSLVSFEASVIDEEDSTEALSLSWSSSLQGALGAGVITTDGTTTLDVETLLPGVHLITLTVTDDEGLVGQDLVSITMNTAPGAPEVTLEPQSPSTVDDLMAVVTLPEDPDRSEDFLTPTFRWLVDGEEVAELSDGSVAASNTTKGETWTVIVSTWDGFDLGPEATAQTVIINAAPECPEAILTPLEPTTQSVLSCGCPERYDDDDDIAEDRCLLLIDGIEAQQVEAIDEACVFDVPLTKGESALCHYIAGDGEDEQEPTLSETVVVVNTAPTTPVVGLDPIEGDVTTTFECVVLESGSDADNDPLSYRRQWRVNGYLNPQVEGTFVIAETLVSDESASGAKRGDAVQCEVSADDGQALSAPALSAPITLGNSLPSGGLVIVGPQGATHGSTMTCTVSGGYDADDDPISWTIAWQINGQTIEGEAGNELNSLQVSKGAAVTCSATPSDGIDEGASIPSGNQIIIANSAPFPPTVSLAPTVATVESTLTCDAQDNGDPDEDTVVLSWQWMVNDYLNPGLNSAVVDVATLTRDSSGEAATKGDTITCVASATDGTTSAESDTSNPVIIINSAPEGGMAVISPTVAYTDADLSCAAEGAVDPDGDVLTYHITWLADGDPIPEQTGSVLEANLTTKGVSYSCQIIPDDGEEEGGVVASSNAVEVKNSEPTAPSVIINPSEGDVFTAFSCELLEEGTDLDGDTLTYTVQWFAASFLNPGELDTPVEPSTLLTSEDGSTLHGGQALVCSVTASDGTAESATAQSTPVILSNTAPEGGDVSIGPLNPGELDVLTCDASGAIDPDGDDVNWTYAWFVNEVEIEVVTGPNLTGVHFDKGQSVRCLATPTDGMNQGQPIQSDASITIVNSAPTSPFATLEPLEAGVLTELQCVIALEADDVDNDPLDYEVVWLVNGYANDVDELIRPAYGLASDAEGTLARAGDDVRCVLRATDGLDVGPEHESNSVVLINTAPQDGAVQILPAEAKETDTLTCTTSGAWDPDGDAITWLYTWYVNDQVVFGATSEALVGALFDSGDTVRCEATPSDGLLSGGTIPSENSVSVANSLPSSPTATLTPLVGGVLDAFNCTIIEDGVDPDGGAVSHEVRWIVNGYLNALQGSVVTPKDLQSSPAGEPVSGGDSLQCRVRAKDDFGFSQPSFTETITLTNTAPVGGEVWVDPPEAADGVTLSCMASGAVDPDGDPITWTYRWFIAGEEIAEQQTDSLASTYFSSGQLVTCSAQPSDGQDAAPFIASSNGVAVGNTVPTQPGVSINPSSGPLTESFTCIIDVPSTDPDGDPVTYETRWIVNGFVNTEVSGSSVTGTELSSDALGTPARGGDTLGCEVRASDGVGLSHPGLSAVITLENTAPQGGEVSLSAEAVQEGDTLICLAAGASDLDGDPVQWSFSWQINGLDVSGVEGDELTGDAFDKGDTIDCNATPTDGQDEGQVVTSSVTAQVLNTLPAVSSVTVTPSEVNRLGTFSCAFDGYSDPDPADATPTVSYQWQLLTDGVMSPIDGATTSTLEAEGLEPGASVFCSVTPSDNDGVGAVATSAAATVINNLPTIQQVALSPGFAFSNDTLTCTAIGTEDIDDDPVTVSYTWLINGDEVLEQSSQTLSGVFDRGETVRCVVTANDGVEDGLAVISNEVTILNTLPTLASLTLGPEAGSTCDTFTCSPGEVSDPDPSDAEVILQRRWELNGEAMPHPFETFSSATLVPGDTIQCFVAPWDGALGSSGQAETGEELASNLAVVGNTPPVVVEVILTPAEPKRGDILTCTPTVATDECDAPLTYSYGWGYNDPNQGEPKFLDVDTVTLDSSILEPGTTIGCAVTANDGFDDSAQVESNRVDLLNAEPTPPVVQVQAPSGADGAVSCVATTPASDGEPLTNTFTWTIDGGDPFTGSSSLSASQVEHCDLITCQLSVSDGVFDVTSNIAELILPFGSDCDDGNACTQDSCDNLGACAYEDLSGIACDDGDACTYADTCSTGTCVGTTYSCDDNDPCTDDVCNGDDSCSYSFNEAPCDDGLPCTLADSCSGGLCSGSAADCSALNTGCFVGICGGVCEAGDDCVCVGASCAACDLVADVGASCDDNDACTLADACDAAGECVGTWDKINCGCTDDTKCLADPQYNDPCHVGRCDLNTFKCTKEPLADGEVCDDGEACTYGDTCQLGVCESTEYDCDDGNPCTDDACAGDGTCTHTHNTDPCDDNDACTTADTCMAGECVSGPPLNCDDDAFCNGLETCNSATGCVLGVAPTLDDGVACTVDTCDEEQDLVVHTPNDSACASDDLCIIDTCDIVDGCVKSVEPDCCGNGTIEVGELCDDGNITSGDGCDASCACECVDIAPQICIAPIATIPDPAGLGATFGPSADKNATAVVQGDVNGDGLDDLIIAWADDSGGADVHDEMRLFINAAPENNGTTWGAGVALPDLPTNAAISDMALADFDRDGDLDLFVTRYGADDRLLLNTGGAAPFLTSGNAVNTGSSYSSAVAVGDIDRDGTLDIAVAHRGAANHVLLNLVPLSPFVGATPIATSAATSDTRDIALYDQDYDGDLDIVTAEYDGVNQNLINIGVTPYFMDSAAFDLGTEALSSTRIGLADFDADGFVDVVIANGANQPDNFYRHPGVIGGVIYGLVGAPPLALASPERLTRGFALMDANLDGRIDLLRATDALNDAVINNDMAYALYQSPAFPVSINDEASNDILTSDYDHDGDIDFLTTQRTGSARYFEVDQTTTLAGVVDPNLLANPVSVVAVGSADVDLDGDRDVFALPSAGAPFVLLNNNSEAPFLYAPSFEVDGADGDVGITMAIGDINQDGRDDIIVGRSGATDVVYLHTLAFPFYATSSAVSLPDTVDTTTLSLALVDFDRDGSLDVITGDDAGALTFYANDRSASLFDSTAKLTITSGLNDIQGLAVGDFDRDGVVDIVASGSGGALLFFGLISSDGYGVSAGEVLSGSGGGWGAVTVGDIDRDGDEDLVIARRSATNLLWLNDGTASPFLGVSPSTLDSTTEDSTSVSLADVDVDGDIDVIVTNSDAVNRVYLTSVATDATVTFAAMAINDPVDSSTSSELASIDNRGRPDLVVGNTNGRLQVFTTPFLDGTLPDTQCAMACPVVPLSCDDALYCNGAEACTSSDECVPGVAPTEDDDIVCTDSVCDEQTDSFIHVPNDANCATTELCSNDYCDVDAGGCVYEQALDCCGNNLLESGEVCEDGNVTAGDGCDELCRCECEQTGPFLCLNKGASTPFDEAPVEGVGASGTSAKDLAFVDLNRDGLLDIIVANSIGANQVFLSTGTVEPFKDVVGLDIPASGDDSRDLAVDDINNDGFMDVAFANDGAPATVYLHNGTDSPFADVTPIALGAEDGLGRALNLVDLNLDGNLDLVVAYKEQSTRVYYHTGTATPFSEETGIDVSSESFNVLAMASADITGNGYPDVVLGTDGFNVMIVNFGPPEFIVSPSSLLITEASAETNDLALEDVDRDGHMDVIAFNDASPSHLILNSGQVEPFKVSDDHVVPLELDDGSSEIQAGMLADLNGDGWLDIVAANRAAPDFWIAHQPDQANPFINSTPTSLATYTNFSSGLDVGDVDLDGDLDVIISNDAAPVQLYLNQANPVEEAIAHPDLDEVTANVRAGVAHDLDYDGDLDLALAHHNEVNTLISNNDTISPFYGSSPTEVGSLSKSSRAIAVGDLNGDGWDDLIVGNQGAPITLWLHNRSSSPFTGVTPISIGSSALSIRDIALGDLNRDGRLDLVIAQNNHEDQLWLNDGDAAPMSTSTPISLGGSDNTTRAVEVTDVDGDGWPDIILGYRTGGHNVTLISDGNDPLTFTTSATGWAWKKTEDIAVADFDGDGRLDVVAANTNDVDILMLHNGTSTPFAHSNAVELGASNTPSKAVAVGDIDNDGDIDIVFGRDGQPNVIYLNNGTSAPFEGVTETAIGDDTYDTVDLALGHFDRDGLLDLVAFDANGVDHFYPNRVLTEKAAPDGCAGGCYPTALSCDDNNPCTLNECSLASGCDFSNILVNCCGNGVLESGEACDDGDVEDGDGCSSSCILE